MHVRIAGERERERFLACMNEWREEEGTIVTSHKVDLLGKCKQNEASETCFSAYVARQRNQR